MPGNCLHMGKDNQNVAHMDESWDNLDNVCGTLV